MHKKIGIANDHAGTAYKFEIINLLESKGFEVINYGTDTEESMDYPDTIHQLGHAIDTGDIPRGIILCGSGNGAAITANKHQKVRAALCWNEELVKLGRAHNDANVLSIPARFVSLYQALSFVKLFLDTPFDGGRHQKRVEKIPL